MDKIMQWTKKHCIIDDALELVSLSTFQWRLFWGCGLTIFTMSMSLNLLLWMYNCKSESSLQQLIFLSLIIGVLFWGFLADTFGRRVSFVLSGNLICLGTLLLCGTTSFWASILIGFGCGACIIPFSTLLEYIPVLYRGPYLMRVQCFWAIGSIVAITFSARLIVKTIVVTVLTIAILAVLIIYFPESPRWLLCVGRKEDAERLIRGVGIVNGLYLPRLSVSDAPDNLLQSNTSHLIRVSVPLWVVWAILGFLTYGYTPLVARLYRNLDTEKKWLDICLLDKLTVGINVCIQVIAILLYSNTVNWGRVCSQAQCFLFGGIAMIVIGASASNVSVTSTVLLIACIAGRGFTYAASAIVCLLTLELYHTSIRSMGLSICCAVYICAAMAGFEFAKNVTDCLTVALVLGFLSLLASGVSFLFLPETAGTVLDSSVVIPTKYELILAYFYPIVDPSCNNNADNSINSRNNNSNNNSSTNSRNDNRKCSDETIASWNTSLFAYTSSLKNMFNKSNNEDVTAAAKASKEYSTRKTTEGRNSNTNYYYYPSDIAGMEAASCPPAAENDSTITTAATATLFVPTPMNRIPVKVTPCSRSTSSSNNNYNNNSHNIHIDTSGCNNNEEIELKKQLHKKHKKYWKSSPDPR